MSPSNEKEGSSVPTTSTQSRPLQQRSLAGRSDELSPPPGMGEPSNEGEVSRNGGHEFVEATPVRSNGVGHKSVLRERFLQLLLAIVGQRVVITRTDGAVIEGVFHTFTPFASQPADVRNRYVVKSCRLVAERSTEPAKESEQEDVRDGSTIIIRADRVSSVHVKSMRLDASTNNGNPNSGVAQNDQNSWRHGNVEMLRTDAEISVGKGVRDRDLVAAGSAWTSEALSHPKGSKEKMEESLEESGATSGRKGFGASKVGGNLRGNIGEWDQFKANEDLFDVRASFDENIYTTELDKSQINRTEMRKAERLAREIENTTSSNMHISEERGQVVQGDYDEEDKFSGVLMRENMSRTRVSGKENKELTPHLGDGKPKGATASGKHEPQPVTPVQSKMNYAAAAKGSAVVFGADKIATTAVDPEGSHPPKIGSSEATYTPSEERVASVGKDPVTSVAVKAKESCALGEAERSDGIADDDHDRVAPVKDNAVESSLSNSSSEKPENKEQFEDEESASVGVTKKKAKSTLNANAKAFTLNPGAKAFTPGAPVGGEGGAQDSHGPEAAVLPPIGAPGTPQSQPQPSHYVQHPAQMAPGMMSMMNARFATAMRFQGTHPYQGIDQHAPPLQPHQQPQHSQQVQPHPGDGGTSVPAVTPADDPGAQQHVQQQGQPSQQQRVPIPYVQPAGAAAYFGGGVAMHRGPGAPHLGYPQQLVSGPQQMPVVPGKTAYHHRFATPGHMQQGGALPVAQMHGGSPYYVAGNMHYATGAYGGHGPVEELGEPDLRSGAKGSGRGGGRRHGRKNVRGGSGRNSHQTNHHVHSGGNGRQTPQNSNVVRSSVSTDDSSEAIGDGSVRDDRV